MILSDRSDFETLEIEPSDEERSGRASEPSDHPEKPAQYFVLHDGGWFIQCDGENSDFYRRRLDALRDALALARLDVGQGRDARVVAQDDDERFHEEWSSSDASLVPQH